MPISAWGVPNLVAGRVAGSPGSWAAPADVLQSDSRPGVNNPYIYIVVVVETHLVDIFVVNMTLEYWENSMNHFG